MRRERGFTLLELMIAVVVAGILATLAVVAYTRIARKARISGEVAEVFGKLKLAEQVWHQERHFYLPLCPRPEGDARDGDCPEGQYWPEPLAGRGATMDATSLPDRWRMLKVGLGRSALHCQYAVIAGRAGDAPVGAIGRTIFPSAPPRDWYYLLAQCDGDADPAINASYWQRDDWTGVNRAHEGR